MQLRFGKGSSNAAGDIGMSEGRSRSEWAGTDLRASAVLLLAAMLLVAVLASPARASLGYQLDSAHPSHALPGPPKGLAVDQATGDIYVAILTTNPNTGALGQIDRFNSDLTADGVFASGGGYYTGVALDPSTGGFFGAQMEIRETPLGNIGTPRMDRFTSAGASAGSFATTYSNSFPPIATDSVGHIYVPNVNTHSVQVFSSTGTLLEEITCSGCPGGTFGKPGSVALTSANELYVADTNPDRVVKLTSSGGAYSFSSTLQSGRGAGAVAVDPSTGDVLVGDMPGGDNYHIVAYNSSGTQFDDFAAGVFPNASSGGYGALSAYQIAVNGTTHKLYVGEFSKFYAFERTTASPPSATAEPPANVGQLAATLKATVNAKGHATLDCDFEYTDEADFQANGFADATHPPCPQNPNGTENTPLSVNVSGLVPSTAYRFRVTASSNAGTTISNSRTFEALPAVPPTVSTGLPQSVSEAGAKLTGTVNPHGGAASDCHFEFGTGLSYGSDFACPKTLGPSTVDLSESKSLSGLKPSTTYHYRLVVSTNAGTTEGDDVAFTTMDPPKEAEPDPVVPPTPSTPPVIVTPPPSVPPPTAQPPRCKKGFKRQKVNGQARCVKVCGKGFRKVRVRAKVKCVPRRHSSRHRRSRAGR
jgi:hypothetical protein